MNTIVRTAVVALALTGSAAYAHIVTNSAKTAIVVTNPHMSAPFCPPSDPGGCGMSSNK